MPPPTDFTLERFKRPTDSGTLRLVSLLVAVVLTSSCGIVGKTKRTFGGILQIEVSVDERLNQNSPVAVELVVVSDKKLVEELEALDASAWFEGREQFFRDHKKGFEHWLWEWVPDQEVEPFQLELKSGARTAFLFADYLSTGSHRAQLDPRQHFKLMLGEHDFEVEAAG